MLFLKLPCCLSCHVHSRHLKCLTDCLTVALLTYYMTPNEKFLPRDQIEGIPVVGGAVDLWALPVVEIDAHGGVDSCPITTNYQLPPPTNYHQLPPVVEIDAHGRVEAWNTLRHTMEKIQTSTNTSKKASMPNAHGRVESFLIQQWTPPTCQCLDRCCLCII